MSTIVTFYSYKGGVGRTMALANVAVILAQQGKRVLAVDWDLEAPGLERYFGYFDLKPAKGGLLPLLQQHRSGSRAHYEPHLARISGRLGRKSFKLDLLPSGRDIDPNYSATLERFDWERYFEREEGGDFVESLRTKWREKYDIVLLDSRTGLSDTGGICTIQLPDTVVAMFTPNHQSLWGVRQTMELAQAARDRLAYDRMHLRVLPVPSRFSLQSGPEAKEWVTRIGRDMELFYQDWIPTWATPTEVVEKLRIPQIDHYSFGEKLAVVEEEANVRAPMVASYDRIARLIADDSPEAETVLRLSRPKSARPRRKTASSSTEGYQYDVYVSHASGSILDSWVDTFMDRLRDELRVQLGRPAEVFLDLSEIRAGDDWSESLRQAIKRSRIMIAFITPEYLASGSGKAEWAHFEAREIETHHRNLIVPLLLRRPASLPDWVAIRQWIDLTELPTTLSIDHFVRHRQTTHPESMALLRLREAAIRIAEALNRAPAFDPHWQVRGPAELARPTPAATPLAAPSGLDLEADAVVALLNQKSSGEALEAARRLAKSLRQSGDYPTLVKVAAAIHRQAPHDQESALDYARGLLGIEDFAKAEAVLNKLAKQTSKSNPAYPEVAGNLGRACKRIFAGERSKTSSRARRYLKKAIGWYRKGYDIEPARNTWHGVNVVALLVAAHRVGLRNTFGLQPKRLARQLLRIHEKIPTSLRDMWYDVAVAELELGLENWPAARTHLSAFAAAPSTDARALNGLLRQLIDIWDLESVPQVGPELVEIVRAALLARPGGAVQLPAAAVRPTTPPALPGAPSTPSAAAANSPPVASGNLEAILGKTQTLSWMREGMQRARSVGAVLNKGTGQRVGTCFLVAARGIGLEQDGLVVLTAAHIVGPDDTALKPSQVQVAFEASEHPTRLDVGKLLWSSPASALDVSLLELAATSPDLVPVPLASQLPDLSEPQRVYVVGHAGGKSLAFSFADNELLDHEGPPEGRPGTPGVVRLHYRAPTEPGSGGSPVFNGHWKVVAVHHARGPLAKLNGKPGTHEASEGIWIQSIAQAVRGLRSERGDREKLTTGALGAVRSG